MNAGRSHRGVGAALLALVLDPAREAAARILRAPGGCENYPCDDVRLVATASHAAGLAGVPLDPLVSRALATRVEPAVLGSVVRVVTRRGGVA